ncbi:MAG TPA: taurine dioxygenase [Flavobacteriaceae bacterium]|nr:taurine dioxygenase [Flavobacteriaceae bacterium]
MEINRFSPSVGAEIRGINLSRGLTDEEFKEVHKAFLDHQVLFFREQKEIPPEVHVEIGKRFGNLHFHPAAPQMEGHPEIFVIHTHRDSKIANGEFWHSDVSCDEEPPLGTMLQLHILPECGGDTMFANMYMAYEALSYPMQKFLSGLKASHESEHFYKGRYKTESNGEVGKEYPSAIHPIIRTHPETGRKAIFVNKFFTISIEGLEPQESKFILDFLFGHIEKTEFQIRYRWNKNDMAFWDNRCTIHKALWDYFPHERKGRRVTIKGSVPF